MEVVLAPTARTDIVRILAWSKETFGPRTASRFAKLIATAIEEIAADPERSGSAGRPEIASNCRTYHLFYARKRAGSRGNRVHRPRHFLLYRVSASGIVEIARILHDGMDLEQQLPEEYRRD